MTDDRLAALEARLATLEAFVGLPAAPVQAPAPARAAAAANVRAWMPNPATRPPAPSPPTVPSAPSAPRPSQAPSPAGRPRSFADLEEQLSSRLLAWVGGIALVLGAMFFLSLAFSRGWIGPEARVVIGLVAGAAAFAAGVWLFERGNRTPATVLTGVAIGTISLALYAAGYLYGFVPVEAALAGFLVVAIAAAVIAVRDRSQAVAAFGLVATTIAPPVLHADPSLATVAYLGVALAGTALVSFWRSWPWLPLLGFLAVAPQANTWFGQEPTIGVALVGLAAFWSVNTIAATGSALAGVRSRVHRADATLLVLNTLVAMAWIQRLLPDPFWRSIATLVLGAGLAVLALLLLARTPARHPYGVLLGGLAAGTLALGMALELGGVARPIGETLLALVVAWVAVRFRDRSAALWAAAIGAVGLADLVLVQYPIHRLGRAVPDGVPFASPEGIVAIVMAAAFALIGEYAWFALRGPRRGRQLTTAPRAFVAGCIGGVGVLAYAAAFELAPEFRVVFWSALAAVAFGIAAFVRRDRGAWQAIAIAGGSLIGLAGWDALRDVAPLSRLVVHPAPPAGSVPAIPLLNTDSLALASIVAALAVGAWVVARWSWTRPFTLGGDRVAAALVATAAGTAIYLMSVAIVDSFQVRVDSAIASGELALQAQVALSIAWVLMGAGAFAVGVVRGVGLARVFGLGLLGLSTAKVFLFDLAALDVAYRVLSFIGLGGVLLASSFVASRFRSGSRPVAGGA